MLKCIYNEYTFNEIELQQPFSGHRRPQITGVKNQDEKRTAFDQGRLQSPMFNEN